MKTKTRLQNIDTELLNKKIAQSGLKMQYIYETMGLSYQNLYDRVNGKIPFSVSEVFHLCHILRITDDNEKNAIFYPVSK